MEAFFPRRKVSPNAAKDLRRPSADLRGPETISSRLLPVSRRFDVAQRSNEIPEDIRRNHDRVTIAANIFCDFHHHPA